MACTSCRQAVENELNDAKQQMSEEKERLKDDLFSRYVQFEKGLDASGAVEADKMFAKLEQTDQLIDSIQGLLSKLKPGDVNAIKDVRNLLVANTAGEKIRSGLNESFDHLRSFSKLDSAKHNKIGSIATNAMSSTSSTKSWQESYFGATDPLGAFIILNALQLEMYKAAIIAFE